jgi:hypothetical protein
MQRSTHCSQICTFGPAMSLRTSFCVLLQNEHLKTLAPPLKIDHMFQQSNAKAEQPWLANFESGPECPAQAGSCESSDSSAPCGNEK